MEISMGANSCMLRADARNVIHVVMTLKICTYNKWGLGWLSG